MPPVSPRARWWQPRASVDYPYDERELYYCSARYYDPAVGAFISKDPARADGEESAYQCCGGDPVGRVDPSGSRAEIPRYPVVYQGNSRNCLYVALRSAIAFVAGKKKSNWELKLQGFRNNVVGQMGRNRRLLKKKYGIDSKGGNYFPKWRQIATEVRDPSPRAYW